MAALTLLCGCSAENAPAVPAPTGAPDAREGSTDGLRGVYVLSGASDTLKGGDYSSGLADEAVLFIEDGVLHADALHMEKTGDTAHAADALLLGQNAAVHARAAGSATLTELQLATDGLGAIGVFCTGEGASVTLQSGRLSTAGDFSPAVAALDPAAVSLDGTELLTAGADAPCLFARSRGTIAATRINGTAAASPFLYLEDGAVQLNGCTLSGAGARLLGAAVLSAEGGSLTAHGNAPLFTVESGESTVTLTGVALTPADGLVLCQAHAGRLLLQCRYQALTGALLASDAAEIELSLQNNSTYTGSFDADERMYLTLRLDETSRWFVTGDSYVEVLADADSALTNIESNGFTVYYNSENEANAWLGSRPYALPGDGYLSPLI